MKRVDLIREIEKSGCVFLRHGVGTTGITIREPAFPSRCRDIAKSRNIWPVTSSEN
jgi:hypothetical protein